MLPDIERAREGGWAVLVLNTNHNTGLDGSRLEGSGSEEEHAESAWKALVQHSSARNIAILAHSYGGVVSMALAAKFKQVRLILFLPTRSGSEILMFSSYRTSWSECRPCC